MLSMSEFSGPGTAVGTFYTPTPGSTGSTPSSVHGGAHHTHLLSFSPSFPLVISKLSAGRRQQAPSSFLSKSRPTRSSSGLWVRPWKWRGRTGMKVTTLLCLLDWVATYPVKTCPSDNRKMHRPRWMEEAEEEMKLSVGSLQTGFHWMLETALRGGHQDPCFAGEKQAQIV